MFIMLKIEFHTRLTAFEQQTNPKGIHELRTFFSIQRLHLEFIFKS